MQAQEQESNSDNFDDQTGSRLTAIATKILTI